MAVTGSDVRYGYTDTPIGRVLLVGTPEVLTGVYVDGHDHTPPLEDHWRPDDGALDRVRAQLDEYFSGDRTAFDLALRPAGSAFQLEVWSALCEIPYGETASYGEIGRRIGRPAASRAVGAANGRNPISIVVPCHRVIGSDGSLTGYGWGVERKTWLLDHEQRRSTSSGAATPRLFDGSAVAM